MANWRTEEVRRRAPFSSKVAPFAGWLLFGLALLALFNYLADGRIPWPFFLWSGGGLLAVFIPTRLRLRAIDRQEEEKTYGGA